MTESYSTFGWGISINQAATYEFRFDKLQFEVIKNSVNGVVNWDKCMKLITLVFYSVVIHFSLKYRSGSLILRKFMLQAKHEIILITVFCLFELRSSYSCVIIRSCNKIMNNKIALINKDLHNKLFQLPDDQHHEPPRIYRRQPLPPQIMLKNMIKKGITNTQTNFLSRPKTAASNFSQTNKPQSSMRLLRSGFASESRKTSSVKKAETESETHVDFNMNVEHPQQFEEFGDILNKMKWEHEQQGVRKKAKLQKYGQRKFNFAWKKYNIPS